MKSLPLNAKVIKVIDKFQIVINRGSEHGVAKDHRFLVFALGEELKDPETDEVLGKLEIVKGVAKVLHIQEKITTLESAQVRNEPSQKRTVRTTTNSQHSAIAQFLGKGPTVEEITETPLPVRAPFEDVVVGDNAKQI